MKLELERGPVFGTDSAGPSDPSGGAVLGGVYDAEIGPDSLLYVLESDWKKVVTFNRDASVGRIVMGGHGEGPGEFVRAVALDTDAEGNLYVLDSALGRVSVFDGDGAFLRHIRTPQIPARDFAVSGDTLFFRVLFGDGEHAVHAASPHWEGTMPLVRTTDVDRAFSLAGFSGAISSDHSGRVIYAFGSPGEFVIIDGPSLSERRGARLFPQAEPTVVETRYGPQRRVEAGTIAVSFVASDHVAIIYATYDPATAEELGSQLALFRVSGEHLATLPLPHPVRVITALDTGHVFLSRSLPFPAMVEYRMHVEGGVL